MATFILPLLFSPDIASRIHCSYKNTPPTSGTRKNKIKKTRRFKVKWLIRELKFGAVLSMFNV